MRHLVLPMLATLALAACGGGSEDAATNPDTTPTAITCNTKAYAADAVAQPTAAELSAYTGTYDGAEGSFDMAGNFAKSGDATMVFDGTSALKYQDKNYTVSSICIDKAAGPYGRLVYVLLVGTDGSFDIADKKVSDDLGQAWGVSPVDGTTVFQQGTKR